jgi:hypothetical protein
MDTERTSEGSGAWLPIETAPRDGTWVLLAGGRCQDESGGQDERRVVSAQWTNHLNGRTGAEYERWQFAWHDGGYDGDYENPTHWQPMPAPPVSA